MSDEPRTQGSRTSEIRRVSHSNNTGMKWVAGAAAAAVLLGGGYYAWKNSTPNTAPSEIADNTATFASPAASEDVSPSAPNDLALNDAQVEKGATASATTETQIATAAPAKQAKARVAAPIPEETIGVSRGATNVSQTDELVVSPSRRPVWRYTPTAERLSEYYPANALDRGREGEASLRCTVGEKGVLDCVRISETPEKSGFGAAALRVAHTFRHAPQRWDGRDAVGTPLNLRVLFRMADSERRRG